MPRKWVIALILLCTGLNGAGFMWNLFEPIPLYDEIAHFITPFMLVVITSEIIYRSGEAMSSSTHRGAPRSRAPLSGSSGPASDPSSAESPDFSAEMRAMAYD